MPTYDETTDLTPQQWRAIIDHYKAKRRPPMPDVTPDLLAAWEMLEEGERPEGMYQHEHGWSGNSFDQYTKEMARDRLLVAMEDVLHESAWKIIRMGGAWEWTLDMGDGNETRVSDPSRFRAALLALRAERTTDDLPFPDADTTQH